MSTSRDRRRACCISDLALRQRPAGGAEAGHGEGLDALARTRRGVERLADHEQGERRIESAGDADGDGRLADVLQPRGQARHLGVEDLLAALAQFAGRVGTNGWASTSRARPRPAWPLQRVNVDAAEFALQARASVPRRRSCRLSAIGAQAIEIDVGDWQMLVALEARRLGQQLAVLRDQAVAAEDDVGASIRRRRRQRRRSRRCSGPTGCTTSCRR